MSELAEALRGESAHAAPGKILEGLGAEVVVRVVSGAPHTTYQELWHICYWLRMSLDWIAGVERAYPATMAEPFAGDPAQESWDALCGRFALEIELAARLAEDMAGLNRRVRCPSRPGEPVRVMTVREQLESLAAHNAYHFGRIVLLRQMMSQWPPRSGGFGW